MTYKFWRKSVRNSKLVVTLFLVTLFFVAFATPALAFDTRGGEEVVISADEVVEGDLYVGANRVIVNGVIQGDLLVGATSIEINGRVEGDLMGGGQDITINGVVQDDVRVGGNMLTLGPEAQVGDDIMMGGFSLEAKPGSSVGGDLLFGGAQALLAGNIARNVMVGVGGLEIQGSIGGDVSAEVGSAGEPLFNPAAFMPQAQQGPQAPQVSSGLTIGDGASIGGELDYSSAQQFNIPDDIVSGAISFDQVVAPQEASLQERAISYVWGGVGRFIALIVIGLVLALLAAPLIRGSTDALAAEPLPSFGWGLLAYFGTPIVLLIIAGLVILIAALLGGLALSGLSSAVLLLGLTFVAGMFIVYAVAVVFLSKIIVGYWLGLSILSSSTESLIGPLLVGLFLVVILISIPWVGFLVSFVVSLMGLGALWLLRSRGQEELYEIG